MTRTLWDWQDSTLALWLATVALLNGASVVIFADDNGLPTGIGVEWTS